MASAPVCQDPSVLNTGLSQATLAVQGAATPNRKAPSSQGVPIMPPRANSPSETKAPAISLPTSIPPMNTAHADPLACPTVTPVCRCHLGAGLATGRTTAEHCTAVHMHSSSSPLQAQATGSHFPQPLLRSLRLTLRWRGAQRKSGGSLYSQIQKKKFDAIAELIRPPKNS
uniref:Uncharacterized protein n=1 Tax=Molossus molossus TaxID=27622 RepID=A0A7J8B8C2_MOLMO|nr:hypothetical protein HJG59_010482 [Molossus molossus]